MNTSSVKLPPALRQRLASEAKRRNLTQSAIVRESLEQLLLADTGDRSELTCADLAGDLGGSARGPCHLSTNKRYLEEAVINNHARSRKRTGRYGIPGCVAQQQRRLSRLGKGALRFSFYRRRGRSTIPVLTPDSA